MLYEYTLAKVERGGTSRDGKGDKKKGQKKRSPKGISEKKNVLTSLEI